MYICQVWLSYITCEDPSHQAYTLANINGLLILDFHYLANILTNTNDKANNLIRKDDNLILQQVNNIDRYCVDKVCR